MPRIRQTRCAALSALALLLGGRAARAQSNVDVLNIDATRSGCTACSSFAGAAPGQVTALVGDKVQLTLGAGTYTVTNAATAAGARPGANPSFTAWTYNSPWTWSFGAANDATGTIVLDDYISAAGGGPFQYPYYTTQAMAAGATAIQSYDGSRLLPGTSTAGFTDAFTLAATTTLDFYIPDTYLPDNAGGVSLMITPVGATTTPEPATWMLVGMGSVLIAGLARRGPARARRRVSDG